MIRRQVRVAHYSRRAASFVCISAGILDSSIARLMASASLAAKTRPTYLAGVPVSRVTIQDTARAGDLPADFAFLAMAATLARPAITNAFRICLKCELSVISGNGSNPLNKVRRYSAE